MCMGRCVGGCRESKCGEALYGDVGRIAGEVRGEGILLANGDEFACLVPLVDDEERGCVWVRF